MKDIAQPSRNQMVSREDRDGGEGRICSLCDHDLKGNVNGKHYRKPRINANKRQLTRMGKKMRPAFAEAMARQAGGIERQGAFQKVVKGCRLKVTGLGMDAKAQEIKCIQFCLNNWECIVYDLFTFTGFLNMLLRRSLAKFINWFLIGL